MVHIEYPITRFIAEIEKALDAGLKPLPAVTQAIHHIGKPYLLKAEQITISGWPLGSITASGKFRDKIFVTRNGDTYIKKYTKPRDPRSPEQIAQRNLMRTANNIWKSMTPEQREEWKVLAINEKMSGYNLFLQTALKRN